MVLSGEISVGTSNACASGNNMQHRQQGNDGLAGADITLNPAQHPLRGNLISIDLCQNTFLCL